MCSIYIMCRITMIGNIQFKEIVEAYRTQMSASACVWRQVGWRAEELVAFYNKTFVKKITKFAFELNKHFKQSISQISSSKSNQNVSSSTSHYITPVNGNGSSVILPSVASLQAIKQTSSGSLCAVNLDFSARRVFDSRCIFVSPGKAHSCAAQSLKSFSGPKVHLLSLEETSLIKVVFVCSIFYLTIIILLSHLPIY